MNYKTIILSALLAGSIHSAWAMDEEPGQEAAQREIIMVRGGWLMNTSQEDDEFNAREAKKAADKLETVELADSNSTDLIAAQKECRDAGINLRETQAPEFEQVAQEYKESLGTHVFNNPDSLALRICTALQTYRLNQDASNKQRSNDEL